MKPFFLSVFAVFFLMTAGAGCAMPGLKPADEAPKTAAYENAEYGFALEYPVPQMEVRERPAEEQDTTYVGKPVKFFASLRDLKREDKPVSITYFYAFDGVTFEQFTEALVATDPANVKIVETTDVEKGGLKMKKVVSTTAIGDNKIHYVWTKDAKLIVASQFLNEDAAFGPVLETFKAL